MHEVDRCGDAVPAQPGVSLAPAHTDAVRSTAAGTLSVPLLAAHEHHESAAVLSVHGEIDLGSAPALREVLLPVVEHQTGPVVVDLSKVPFMDSSGVHVLVDTLHRLEPQNRPLTLVCHEEGPVHRILALVGLLDALTVRHSRESAVTAGDDVLRPVIH